VPREDFVTVEGRIVDVLGPTLFRVILENGHRLMGHLPRRLASAGVGLSNGKMVQVQVSPFDFSKGRILIGEKENDL